MDLARLHDPFPRASVHWRAQSVNNDKTKALALAYIDARDVMDRLDAVCGPDRWQSEITETARGRVICKLGILTEFGWVWKSDGAGDTDVEGEKGGISDALKRAAVAWGVGRYLYRLSAPWVPCEVGQNGKWRKWTADPWDYVRSAPPQSYDPAQDVAKIADAKTGKNLLAVIPKAHIEHPEIRAAIVESLLRIVKGAQHEMVLDRLAHYFAFIWSDVAVDAQARRIELARAA